jgi:predicted outer membrane protein
MCKTIVSCIAILAVHALAACGDDSKHSDIESRALDEGTTRGQALQAQAAQDFAGCTESEAIGKAAGVVFAINDGEIAQASFVLSKTGDVRVRALATQIAADHQASNAALLTLLHNRNVAPIETSVSGALTSEANAGLAQLRAGELRNINIDYTQIQITMHQEALLIVGTVRDAVPASATDIRGFLSDALTMIGDHQARAETVLRNLP